MKKIFIILLFIHCSLLIVNAQWQTDIRLTNDPASSRTSGTNVKCIGSEGNIVHVFWEDSRDGNNEIYYIRSTDGGISWGVNNRLTSSSGSSGLPALAISGQDLHIVWEDNRDGNGEIYYKNSTNSGISWGADTRLTNYAQNSNVPAISISGQVLHVVWVDYRGGSPKIYYKRSANAGVSWGPDSLLIGSPPTSICPTISSSGLTLHLAWMDTRNGNDEIYYKRSLDGGLSWGVDTRMSFNSQISLGPCITANEQNVHLVWSEPPQSFNTSEIYYKRSTDGGASWLPDTMLTNYANASVYPSISASGSFLHLAWTDFRDANYEIYYKYSSNAGLSWNPDTRITNYPATSEQSHIEVSGQTLHVVWSENHDGNFEIYYKRNPTGNPTGLGKINSNIPDEFLLYQNYPNPFNPKTKIKFSIPFAGDAYMRPVRIIIYDVLGNEIETLFSDKLQPGTYEIDFDGSKYSSGIYYYKLSTGSYSDTKKMILIK